MYKNNIENPIGGRNDEFFATRHSIAEYKLNEEIVKSDNPETSPDAKKQWFNSDLTPEGKIFAREKAEEFFNTLNSKTDALFFVSSDLVRAAETAKIYMDVARERGFEIILPRKKSEKFPEPRNKAEEIGEGSIRKINSLTLDHLENMLREQVFKPNDVLSEVVEHPENVSEETREKWSEARKIIESDNKGAWGPNYAAHSEAIAKIFSNVKSAKEIYDSKFLNMMRLVEFGQKKINEAKPEKNIKILGFSHENSFLYFLNKNFDESMNNCETIAFKVEASVDDETPDKIFARAKSKTIEVNK